MDNIHLLLLFVPPPVVPWAPVPVVSPSVSLNPPPRPNFGQIGRPIGLRANHFQVSLSIYTYV